MIIANMQVTTRSPVPPRLAAFVLGLLLAGSVVAWWLRWPAQDGGTALPPAVGAGELPAASLPDVTRLLGAGAVATVAAAPDAASRFRLTGIIATGAGHGVALIAVDGQPPKPYRVGSLLEAGWMLQSVEQRRVALASDAKAAPALQLELPPRQP